MVSWLIFGGWALPPFLLEPLFGPDAAYIDVNVIMPFLVNGGKLHGDWQDRLFDIVKKSPGIPDKPFGIAGWSTGAILAWSLAGRLEPATSVFISTTPSFCRRRESGFSYGQKSSVLKSMREQLSIDPDTVVKKFYSQCGIRFPLETDNATLQNPHQSIHDTIILRQAQDERINDYKTFKIFRNYSCEQLVSGLHFLEQSTLLPVNRFSFPALFLHGKNDTIISIDAGRYFSTEAGGTFVEHEGPHAFFLDDPAALTKNINDFMRRAL